MQWRIATCFVLLCCVLGAVIIDRIAVVVGNSIVKDSDIERDVKVTDFLNGQPPMPNAAERRAAANRLIDQIFIRREIELGNYPVATMEETAQELSKLEKDRFKTAAALQKSLHLYGLKEADLKSYFHWQLTVLRFVDARFRPSVLVTDEEIAKYYQQHAAAFKKEHPDKSSLDDVRGEINTILASQRVDKVFFSWLDEQRKDAKIKYFEESLR